MATSSHPFIISLIGLLIQIKICKFLGKFCKEVKLLLLQYNSPKFLFKTGKNVN